MTEEEFTPLGDTNGMRDKTRRKISTLSVLVISLVGATCVSFYRSVATNPSPSVTETTSLVTNSHLSTHDAPMQNGWYMYKTAFAASNHSWTEIYEFLRDYSGGYNCELIGLGCDGKKLSCSYGGDYDGLWDSQLHFVVAPENLLFSKAKDGDGLGTSGWQRVAEESFGSMDSFSPFMHNKVQLFSGNITNTVTQLQKTYHLFKRVSPYGDTHAAHVSVAVGGKIFEFVGYIPAPEKANELGLNIKWSPEECPSAHKINANMTALQALYNEGLRTPLKYNRENSTYWISTHSVIPDLESTGYQTVRKHLTDKIGAIVQEESELDDQGDLSCQVATFSLKNTDSESWTSASVKGNVDLRFVMNNHYQSLQSGHSISEYTQYIDAVHRRYLKDDNDEILDGDFETRWRNWDHWLDQHVGFKWAGADGCSDQSKLVTDALLESEELVGKRAASDGDHFYVGYEDAPMTIEYNTEQCYHGEGETAVCFCDHENSNRLTYLSNADADCLTDDVF